MSLQRFKLGVANSVVNMENASLSSMDAGQVLDLFTVSSDQQTAKIQAQQEESVLDEFGNVITKKKMSTSALKNVLEGIETLWDESQYDDLDAKQFLKKL